MLVSHFLWLAKSLECLFATNANPHCDEQIHFAKKGWKVNMVRELEGTEGMGKTGVHSLWPVTMKLRGLVESDEGKVSCCLVEGKRGG